MITVYDAHETDFTHNGLGPIDPIMCEVSETLNGEWSLELTHARDELGKCERLKIGNIIKAPVPAGYTPAIRGSSGGSGGEIWRVNTSRDNLYLRSGPGTGYSAISKYPRGAEVAVISKDGNWYEVTTPDGKHGWMYASYLVYVRTDESAEDAGEEIREAKALRDQPFRIYRIEQGISTVNVYARHIFYDLMDNLVDDYQGETVTGAAAAQAALEHCRGEHGFTMYSDLEETGDVDFADLNPVEALLGSKGLTETFSAELARDWFDVYAVKRVGRDTDIVIRQGKDLVDLTGDLNVTGAVTRIVPVGQTKQGEPLYLPEVYVESEAEDAPAYALVKWGSLKVSDAKVGKDGMTTEQAYEAMREAAKAEFDKGCDQPEYTLDVDFVNLGETVEYKAYGVLYELGIGDSVRVVCPSADVDTRLRLTEYVYDCLSRRFTSCKLGTVEDYASAIAKAGNYSSGGGGYAGTAAYRPDSEATTVETLRADFNALLRALQRAGLMRGSGS